MSRATTKIFLALLLLGGAIILGLSAPLNLWTVGLLGLLIGGAGATWFWPTQAPQESPEQDLRDDLEQQLEAFSQNAESQPVSQDEGRPSEQPRQELLWQAVLRGDLDEVQSAQIAGGLVNDVDEQGRSLLTLAVAQGKANIVKALLEGQADPHLGHPLPLHVAIEQGHLGLFWLLLGGGADPERRDENGVDAWGPACKMAGAQPLILVSLLRLFPDEAPARLGTLPAEQQPGIQELWDAWLAFRRRRRMER